MNRTERAIKRRLRETENGRSSFKTVCLDAIRTFDYSKANSSLLKDLQHQLKNERAKTRGFMSQIKTKEANEI